MGGTPNRHGSKRLPNTSSTRTCARCHRGSGSGITRAALADWDEISHIESTDHRAPLELVPLDKHPIDDLWNERPNGKSKAPFPHAIEYSGEDSSIKRKRIGDELKRAGADAIVFSNPNATAWLLNIRGDDVPHTPVALCRAVLHADGKAAAFFAGHEISEELKSHLGADVEISGEADFGDYLRTLGAEKKTVLINKAVCPGFVHQALSESGATIREGEDPLILFRGIKNEVEVEGFRKAHVRDGVAMVKFLHWLENNWMNDISEIDAVERLEAFRVEDDALHDISFDTISGSGPNGAIIHYRVSEASNRKLADGELFLVDSGGQYLEGTTDITRTIALGEPAGYSCAATIVECRCRLCAWHRPRRWHVPGRTRRAAEHRQAGADSGVTGWHDPVE